MSPGDAATPTLPHPDQGGHGAPNPTPHPGAKSCNLRRPACRNTRTPSDRPLRCDERTRATDHRISGMIWDNMGSYGRQRS